MTGLLRENAVGKRVAVTGATGFIGRPLVAELVARGYAVVALSRESSPSGFPAGVEVRRFDSAQSAPSPQAFEGVDAVIHLAGESVGGRWTAQKKQRIRDSRVLGTRSLVASLAACSRKPEALICASAVGYYGSRGDESLTERSRPGSGFLADVVVEWERECAAAERFGVRTVSLRTGIVLGAGGALAQMIPPFRFGLGGPFGSGSQFVPWIHLDDTIAMYIFALEHVELRGPVNAVAPDYATSARFALALGSALRRPAYVPAPGFALHAVLGEFAQTLLASQLVLPAVAEDAGFAWTHPNLEAAMLAAVSPGRARSTNVRRFERTQLVPAPLEDVFAFFSEARNLESITPRSLRFEMRSAPAQMRRGEQILYRLHVHGLPMTWRTLVASWKAPHSFVDVQLHGPYALWRHRHDFESVPGGVLIRDTVDYVLPFAPLGNVAQPLVESDVRAIFEFRRQTIEKRFGATAGAQVASFAPP